MKRGDKPVDGPGGLDEACGKYKIKMYNSKSKEEDKKALNEFISDIDKTKRDSKIKSALKNYYKAKKIYNDAGLADDKERDNVYMENDNNEDEKVMNELEKEDMKMEGSGFMKKKGRKKKKKYPGYSLKMKLYKKYNS